MKNEKTRVAAVEQCNFIDFDVYAVEEIGKEKRLVDIPGFVEEEGFVVFCEGPNCFMQCFKRLDDRAILKFAADLEVFNRRFDKYLACHGKNLDKQVANSLREEAKSYIMDRAQKLNFDPLKNVPSYNYLGGLNVKPKGKFAYDGFDYFAVTDKNGGMVPSEYPVFYAIDRKKIGVAICGTVENFLSGVERLSNAAVMNILADKQDFYEKYLVLADHFDYEDIRIEPIFDEAISILEAREKEIMSGKFAPVNK